MPPLTFTVYFVIFLLPLLYKNSKSHRGFSAWADKTLRSWSQSDSNIVWAANPYQMELNCEQNCSIVVHRPSLSAWFSDEAIGKTSKNRWLQTEQERREERGSEWELEREKREGPLLLNHVVWQRAGVQNSSVSVIYLYMWAPNSYQIHFVYRNTH